MKTYPLESLSIEEAKDLQFRIVDTITQVFKGHEMLSRGDLGVVKGLNKPVTTKKVEEVIAKMFSQEAALLVRGAGSGAIRFALHSVAKAGDTVLVHKAPIYNTTKYSMEMLGLRTVEADFNTLEEVKAVLRREKDIKLALIQHTRQMPEDRYSMKEVINTIKSVSAIPIITDDNYATFKVRKIGCESGADLSCFSAFKLLGPEGIGVITGKQQYIDILEKESYSGGMQVQGHEAMDVLRGFVYAPVSLAIQAQVNEECVKRLNEGEVPHVKTAFLANAQSKVLLVEFDSDIAENVLTEAERLGAAPNPVGAESKYEIVPMFYRVSGTFRNYDSSFEKRMIRINPMRSGSDTVIRILSECVRRVFSVS